MTFQIFLISYLYLNYCLIVNLYYKTSPSTKEYSMQNKYIYHLHLFYQVYIYNTFHVVILKAYYCENGKLFVKDDFTPSIVRRIFRGILSGIGFDAIARNLYNDDIPTPSQVACIKSASSKWNEGSSVRCILENPHFIGNLVQGRTTTKSVTSIKEILLLMKI